MSETPTKEISLLKELVDLVKTTGFPIVMTLLVYVDMRSQIIILQDLIRELCVKVG